MKNVFVVVRDHDIDGYGIAGIYENKIDAEAALLKNNKDSYGFIETNRIEEIPLNTYFDIGDISL